MIFSKLKYPAVFFAAAFLLNSCAQEPSESSRASELRLLSSTKEMYFPNATQLGGYTDGSLWLISHSQGLGSGNTPAEGNYVAFEYTGRELPKSGGKIFQSTDSTIARQLNKFTYDIHFAPMFYCDTPNIISPAMIEALKLMSEGDTVTVMSASWLMYGANTFSSFSGEVSLLANTPIIFTVVLKEIELDPKMRELNMVKEYVAAHPEKDFVLAKDNEGNELPGFYISYKDTVSLQDSAFYAATDDSVYIKYAGYYLEDNFLLKTNIDSAAKKGWNVVTNDSTNHGFIFSETAEYTAEIPAYYYAPFRVAAGSWIECVFTSDYGYGTTGTSAIATNRPVYSYTPLRFRFYVAKITAN